MIFNIIKRRHIYYILLFTLFFLASCSEKGENNSRDVASSAESYPEYAEEAAAPTESYPEYVDEAAAPTSSYPEYAEESTASTERYLEITGSYPEYADETAASTESYPEYAENTNRIDEYSVVLGADEKIKIPGIPGELRVWIGSPSYKPDFPDHMIQDEATVPAVGESATVQPFALAFKIDPIETKCIKIHPSGSEVRFKLIPQKQGLFEVGANVYLFESLDCSGSPIPKTTATLKVLVEVNQKEIIVEKANELWNVLWEKFVEFWGALVVIFFGVILFLTKSKLKKWFGYEDD